MELLFGGDTCIKCGHAVQEPQLPQALPYGVCLRGKYLVGRAKKYGGQGFVYIGYDKALKNKIAIREYFPKALCQRAANGIEAMTNQPCYELYTAGLQQFLAYSRTVAHVQELTAVAHTYDIFEANGTAYTVADWDEQVTLRYFIEKSGGHLDWNSARQLFMPVLSALSVLHEQNIGHYGISPDSLSIMENGKMKLGDFCIEAVRREGGGLGADLVSGCAALEQYSQAEALTEATDVYGFAASLFYALTGLLPEKAVRRRADARLLIPTNILKEMPPHVVTSLANALQVYPQKRTQTFERLRAELSASPTITAVIEETQSIPKLTEDELRKMKASANIKEPKGSHFLPVWVWVLFSILAVAVAAVMIALLYSTNENTPGTDEGESLVIVSESEATKSEALTDSNAIPSAKTLTPDLVGKNYSVVKASLAQQQADYEVIARYAFHDAVQEGNIISQTPKAGDEINKGGTIVLEVSRGPYERTLPNVTGMAYEKAEKQLKEQGFELSVQYEYDADVMPGYVIGYSNLTSGDTLQYGASVTVLVSAEDQEVPTP